MTKSDLANVIEKEIDRLRKLVDLLDLEAPDLPPRKRHRKKLGGIVKRLGRALARIPR